LCENGAKRERRPENSAYTAASRFHACPVDLPRETHARPVRRGRSRGISELLPSTGPIRVARALFITDSSVSAAAPRFANAEPRPRAEVCCFALKRVPRARASASPKLMFRTET